MRRLLKEDGPVRPIADINMTNLVDVTLTLLVLFILIAPVIDQGFSLELPRARGDAVRTVDAVNVAIDSRGRISLEGRSLTLEELKEAAKKVYKGAARDNVIIIADEGISYGRVVDVMNVVNSVGFEKISLATKEEDH